MFNGRQQDKVDALCMIQNQTDRDEYGEQINKNLYDLFMSSTNDMCTFSSTLKPISVALRCVSVAIIVIVRRLVTIMLLLQVAAEKVDVLGVTTVRQIIDSVGVESRSQEEMHSHHS